MKLSQFLDPLDQHTLWSHEKSFRRKTGNLISAAIERETRDKKLMPTIISNLGNHIARTADTIDSIKKKTGAAYDGGKAIVSINTALSSANREASTISTSKRDTSANRTTQSHNYFSRQS